MNKWMNKLIEYSYEWRDEWIDTSKEMQEGI